MWQLPHTYISIHIYIHIYTYLATMWQAVCPNTVYSLKNCVFIEKNLNTVYSLKKSNQLPY